jgi:C4-type Zn-finger protein
VQDHILSDKMELVAEKQGDCCPKCQNKLNQAGKQDSPLHDVLTDHTVLIQRVRCLKCGFKTPSTVNQLIGTTMTGELTKIQAELGNRSF